MSHGRELSTTFSYMDGVPVKIGEKYKPPRKISLPVGFQQRVSYEIGSDEYDFRLERSVLEKMGEWRSLRKAEADSRKERIKAQDDAWQKKMCEDVQKFSINSTSGKYENVPPENSGASNVTHSDPRRSSFDDQQMSGRTLSKSVPDIVQELEKELAVKRVAENSAAASRMSHTPPPRPNSFGSAGLEDWKPWPDLDSPEPLNSKQKKSPAKLAKKASELPNPFHELSASNQQLANHISEMGFDLPRVARACKLFGEDDKKVVEFLLQVQALEEKKWPDDLAEKALVINKHNITEAVRYLEALTQLLDLGFPEDKVAEALVMFQNDRDKALDHLIS